MRRALLILVVGGRFADSDAEIADESPPSDDQRLTSASSRVTELANVLGRFGYEVSMVVDGTARKISAAVREAIQAAGSDDALVVHVLSHSVVDRSGALSVLGADGRLSSVNEWIQHASHRADTAGTLFLLDLDVGDPDLNREGARTWIVARTGPENAVLNGALTTATTTALTKVLDDGHALGSDIRFVPFDAFATEISLESGFTWLDGPAEEPFPFFPNPAYDATATPPTPLVVTVLPDTGRARSLAAYKLDDGRPVVAVGSDSLISLFDLRTGQRLARTNANTVRGLVQPPGSGLLICASRRGTVEARSYRDLLPRGTLWEQHHPVNALATSTADSRWLVCSASDDGSIQVRDQTGAPGLRVTQTREGAVNAVAFVGPRIVSGSSVGTIAAWDIETGNHLWLRRLNGSVNSLAVITLGGQQLVVSGSQDGQLGIWDPESGEPVDVSPSWSGPIHAAVSLPRHPWVAIGGANGIVRVWDAGRRKQLAEIQTGHAVLSLAAAEVDGQTVVVIGDDRGAHIWPLTKTPAVPPPPPALHAGYAADTVRGPDQLGISAQVDTLCQLIMARNIEPPLSIGLFGDWGTGKSFFMSEMRKGLDRLAERSRRAELQGVESGLCSGVCAIEFNAWHYLDANLWAGLGSVIFDRLAATEADTDDLVQDLPSVRALRAELEGLRDRAEHGLDKLARDLAVEERIAVGQLLTIDTLRQKADDATEEALDEVGTALEQAGVAQVDRADLRTVSEAADITRRAWYLLRRGQLLTRLSLLAAFVLAVVAGPLLGWLLVDALDSGVAALAPLLLCGAAGLRLAGPALNRLRGVVEQVEPLVARVDERRRIALRAREEKLNAQIAQTTEQIASLDDQLRTLNESRSVQAYAMKRLSDDEYRRNEGLMAVLRRDLEELSRRLTPASAPKARSPSSPADLERIVLYIDDLDRCPPARVVEVLQAVQLLLAFPLFVVVVGVDSRWLLRSVQAHYSDVLGAGESPVAGWEDTRHWASTPQNYLEKIFQISVCLAPMSEAGYARLVEADLGESLPAEPDGASDRVLPVPMTPGTRDRRVPPTDERPQPGVTEPPPTREPQPPRRTAPSVPATELVRYRAEKPVVALGLSGDRPLLMVVDKSTRLYLGDPRARGDLELQQKIARSDLSTASITTDGRVLLTGWFDDGIALAAASTGEVVDRVGRPFPPSSDVELEAVFSANGSAVGLTRVETARKSAAHLTLPLGRTPDSADFDDAAPGRLLAFTAAGAVIQYPDAVTWLGPDGEPTLRSDPARVDRAVTDPDGRFLALVGDGTVLGLWALSGTAPPTSLPIPEPPPSGVTALALGTSGLLGAAAGSRFRAWDLNTGDLRTEESAATTVTAMAFSPDGRRLATGCEDGTVQVWLIDVPDPDVAVKLEALRLMHDEHRMIIAVQPLIGTPRTARRLVNTYRLLRSTLDGERLRQLHAGGYRPVILLLAVLVGHPAQGAAVLEELLAPQPEPTTSGFAALFADVRDHLPSPGLASAVKAVALATGATDEVAEYREWAPYVARFSFRTAHLL